MLTINHCTFVQNFKVIAMESIKLKRGVFTSCEFENPARFKLFVALLFMAEQEQTIKSEVELRRGQLLTSLSLLAARTSLTIKQVRNALAALKKGGKITTCSTHLYTVVTICDYESYVNE